MREITTLFLYPFDGCAFTPESVDVQHIHLINVSMYGKSHVYAVHGLCEEQISLLGTYLSLLGTYLSLLGTFLCS